MSERFPPGPDHNVFQAVLSTLQQQRDRLAFLVAMAHRYGDICHFHTGARNIYLLVNPDYIHSALVEQADKFYKTRPFKRVFGRFLGQGLFVLEGNEHRRARRLTQPAFHYQRVAAYAGIMVEHTQRLIDRWTPGKEYDIAQEMMRLTLSIVARTLFDADVSGETQSVAEAMMILQDATMQQFRLAIHAPHWFPTAQNRKEQFAIKLLDEIIFRIIDERRSSGADKGDLLSMLLLTEDDEGGKNSIQQVRDELISMFLAGHETTANALTWAWYLLAQHPEVVSKLQRELDDVLSGHLPGAGDVDRLPYATMIIKETLRLYPPAWVITREAIADVTIAGYTLKEGSVVVTSPYITHRLPTYYTDPDQFRPERFTSGYEQSLPRSAYFPFGGGPRVCIGQSFAMMEAVLILATIAQQYRLKLVPRQEVEIEPLVTLRAKHGIRMRATSAN